MKKIKAKKLIKYLRGWERHCSAAGREYAAECRYGSAYKQIIQAELLDEVIEGIQNEFPCEELEDE